MLAAYFDPGQETKVGQLIASLGHDSKQTATMRQVIDGVLTYSFYTLLLALDGGASLGGVQQISQLRDEAGQRISGDGELESAAFEHFQE